MLKRSNRIAIIMSCIVVSQLQASQMSREERHLLQTPEGLIAFSKTPSSTAYKILGIPEDLFDKNAVESAYKIKRMVFNLDKNDLSPHAAEVANILSNARATILDQITSSENIDLSDLKFEYARTEEEREAERQAFSEKNLIASESALDELYQGLKYSKGDGVTQSFSKAAEYLIEASRNADRALAEVATKALFNNFKRASEQKEKPQARGWAHAELAGLYSQGINGIEKNLAKAFYHYGEAAKQTDNLPVRALALFKMGNIKYNEGSPEAITYYEQAANQNDSPSYRAWALLNLGNAYFYDKINLQDCEKAYFYYSQAAKQTDDSEVAQLAQEQLNILKSSQPSPPGGH